jgi:hypothetical protein
MRLKSKYLEVFELLDAQAWRGVSQLSNREFKLLVDKDLYDTG